MSDQPLVVVTGEPGSGKSTLAKWLFQDLPADTHEVLLTAMVQAETTADWLSPRLAELMGISVSDEATGANLRHVAARLDELIAEHRKLVVIIDSSHLATTPAALGEIAALLNLQTLAGTCLSFVLIGDTSLLAPLGEAIDLRAKVAFNAELPPLALSDTGAYLADRAKASGIEMPFEADAVQLIHQRSRGVFATINVYAENCLIEAFEQGASPVTAAIAKAAARHLGPERPAPRAPQSLTGLGPAEPAPSEAHRADSVAIKLASLFKSEPGRQKP